MINWVGKIVIVVIVTVSSGLPTDFYRLVRPHLGPPKKLA